MRRTRLALTLALVLGTPVFAHAREGDAAAPPAQAAADVLTLADGRKISGRIVEEDEKLVSIESGGTTRAYPRDTISSIERAPRPAAGQEPAAGADKSPPPGKEKKPPKTDRMDTPLSDTAKAWLDALIAKSAENDESVRRSVAAAISALGRPAVPPLRAAAEAAQEGPQKQFLTRLADGIESQRDRKMRGEGPDGPKPTAADPGRKAFQGLMARIAEELELRDDQKAKVEAVLLDIVKKRGQLHHAAQAEGLDAAAIAEKVAALRTDLLTQMKAVLDEPQYALFQEMAARIVETPKAPPPKPKDAAGAPPAPPPGDDQPKK